jgi:hypothetical protein
MSMLLEKDRRIIYLLIMILVALQHMKLAIVLGLHIYGAMQIAEVMKLMTLLCTILPILVVLNKAFKHLYRNSLEMWMNYMDYTDDRCMYFFSDGQASRADFFIDTDPQLNSIINSACTNAREAIMILQLHQIILSIPQEL